MSYKRKQSYRMRQVMKEVLNVQEACTYLQVGKPILYRYVRAGEIPHFRLGRVLRFHRESLEKWVEEKVTKDTTARQGKS